MTLKEKFYPYCDNEYFDKWVSAEYCEDVADDFAVGFAEWSSYYRDKNKNYKEEMLHAISKYDESYTTKELLEIYKKEKEL